MRGLRRTLIRSDEGVLDEEGVELLAVLEIFGVEDAAIGFESGGDGEGVVPGEREAAGEFEGAKLSRRKAASLGALRAALESRLRGSALKIVAKEPRAV